MGEIDWEAFRRERDDALLSLDLVRINAYAAKYGSPLIPDTVTGWAGIHKARAALPAMPQEARDTSLAWLAAHGFKPLGGGTP